MAPVGGYVMTAPLLRVQDLDCGILSGVGFSIAEGECVGLAGPSGSGKTRLLRAIADLDPNRGDVFLRDQARSSMPAHQWRRRVGLLPADSQWWGETVAEHMPPPDAQDLQALHLDADVLGWKVARLSSGERQRLALLRLLSRNPEVLLLDEPTANLDRENTRAVEAWLGAMTGERGMGMLWVSHDPAQLARVARRSVRIDRGGLEPMEPCTSSP
jgi:sulfonate transport system ATP-binding protein